MSEVKQAPKLKYMHRYSYAVVDNLGVVTFTNSRKDARAYKKILGGSPKVKIVQFKANEVVR